jgi:hypothetical protein
MTVEVQCSACRRRLDVSEAMLGRPVTCPDCGTTFVAQADPFQLEPDPITLEARRRAQAAGRFALILITLLALGGGGFLVWWYFIIDHTPALPAADMEALQHLPSSCYLVAGVDVQNTLRVPELAGLLKQRCFRPGDTALAELLRGTLGLDLEDVDHLAYGLSDQQPLGLFRFKRKVAVKAELPTTTLVLRTVRPMERERILRRSGAGPPQLRFGKAYHPLPGKTGFSLLHFPTEHVIVLVDVPAGQQDTVPGPGRRPGLAYDLMNMLKQVGKAHAWVVSTRGPWPREFLDVTEEERRLGRAFACWIKVQGQKGDLGFGVVCHNWVSARRWTERLATGKPQLDARVQALAGAQNRELAREFLDNLRFNHKDGFAWALMRVRLSALQQLLSFKLPRLAVGASP